MIKRASIIIIFTVIIIFFAFGGTPDENVTDSKSVIKNVKQGFVTDTVIKAGGEVIDTIGNQAIDSACSNGSSQTCARTTATINTIGVAFAILVIVIIIAGIIGFAKFIMNLIESFA